MSEAKEIQEQIAGLEGKLASLAGEGLLISADGYEREIPDGGALLHYASPIEGQSDTTWYPTADQAKAALAALARRMGHTVRGDGFYADLTPPGCVSSSAWVERRQPAHPQTPGLVIHSEPGSYAWPFYAHFAKHCGGSSSDGDRRIIEAVRQLVGPAAIEAAVLASTMFEVYLTDKAKENRPWWPSFVLDPEKLKQKVIALGGPKCWPGKEGGPKGDTAGAWLGYYDQRIWGALPADQLEGWNPSWERVLGPLA